MENIKNLARFTLGFPLTIISFYFIFKFIFDNFSEIYPRIQNFNVLPFSLGLLFLIIFFLFRSLAWNKLLEQEGYKLGTARSIYFYSLSEIRRYIPTSFLAFVSRVYKFNALKVPTRITLKLIFYEAIIFIISNFIISIPGIIFITQKLLNPQILTITVSFISILLFFAILFLKNTANAKFFLKNAYEFTAPLYFMIAAWIFFGVGNLLIAASIYYLDPHKIVELSSLFVLSWLVGYLVLFVPLGLGIREAAITYGLSFFVPLPIAAAVAIFSRIALIFSDIAYLLASLIFYKFVKIKLRLDYYSVILWSSISSYIAYFSYVSFEKHLNFFTGRFDLGNMDQTVWNTLHGRIFELTNPDGINIISRLAIHADFILILLSPFYLIWEDPRMLLLIQTVVLGFGAYFVFKISEVVIKNQFISLAFSLSYLLNPFVQKQNLFDFHAVTLATTFLLATFYFSLINRYKFSLLFLLLAVLTKENIYITSFIFGIFLFVKTRNKLFLLLSLFPLVAFYVIVSKLIPDARGSAHFASEYFQDFGETPAEIAKNIFLNPISTFSRLFSLSSSSYVYKLFLPLGFLSLFAPLYLIFAGADVGINLLSENENFRSLTFHYAAAIIPFVYISGIYGTKFLASQKIRLFTLKNFGFFILISSLFTAYSYGTLPGSKNPSLEVYERHLKDRDEIIKFLDDIPKELSVAATNNLGAHLSHRQKLYTIPYGIYDADVVFFLLNDPYAQPSLEQQRQWANALKFNEDYIELYRIGDFLAFSKKGVASMIKSCNSLLPC